MQKHTLRRLPLLLAAAFASEWIYAADTAQDVLGLLQNVVPSHLADTELFDFVGLERGQNLKHGGDLAFDSEKMPERFSDGSEEDESEIKIEPQKAERKVINILANKPKTCGL